jgi:phage tail sheath protein FI
MARFIAAMLVFAMISAGATGTAVYGEEYPTVVLPEVPIRIEGVEASVSGFLGETERGPAEPRLVTSWDEYGMLYGGNKNTSSYLPHSVRGFFENGGKKLYVARVIDSEAASAAVKLFAGKAPALTLRAIGEGSWGNRIQVRVSEASGSSEHNPMFRLEICYWDAKPFDKINNTKLSKLKTFPSVTEVFDNLSMKHEDINYYKSIINRNSRLITADMEAGDSGLMPDSFKEPIFLSGGNDGGSIDLEDYLGHKKGLAGVRGLAALDAIDGISLLYCPDALSVAGLARELIRSCERLEDRIVILDSQKGDTDPMGNEDFNSSYAALYYPWIMIDGGSKTQLPVPPGGHIAGIYAWAEAQYGISKAPAGMVIKGAEGLEFDMDQHDTDILNSRGINSIRDFEGRGITVWGARTLASEADAEYRYINLRRLKNYIKESIKEGLYYTSDCYNNQELWAEVKSVITDFLTQEWRKGCFMGTTARDAFYVMVDRSTMNQADIEEGRLIIDIGAAFLRPAEFYIIRIMLPVRGSN